MPIPFSQRLDWTLATNPISQALATTKPRLDLTASNPTKAGLHYPEAILAGFRDPQGLKYTPDPRGIDEARAALHLGPHTLLSASTS